MRIKKITIENMKCFTHFEQQLPAVALLTGTNGSGKSSFQACLLYPFESGHDPGMIRNGVDAGEVVLEFDDGTLLRAVAERHSGKGQRLKRGRTVREYLPPDGNKWLPAAGFTESIAQSVTYDPLKPQIRDAVRGSRVIGIDAPDSEQLALLLHVMPLPVDEKKFRHAVGANTIPTPAEISAMDGIGRIDHAYQTIFERRTNINREKDIFSGHAKALRDSLPSDLGDVDWSAEKARLAMEKENLETAQREALDKAREDFRKIELKAEKLITTLSGEIDADINAKIAALEAERNQRKDAMRADKSVAVAEARTKLEAAVETINADYQPHVLKLAIEHSHAGQNELARAKAAGTAQAITKAERDFEGAAAQSEKLTGALDRLKNLRVELAEQLLRQIPDITIDSGRICRYERDGEVIPPAEARETDYLIPFSDWNTAARIVFRLRLAVLSRGELPFVVVDSIGDLDPDTLAAVEESCQRYAVQGMQFIFGKAKDGALSIRSGIAA